MTEFASIYDKFLSKIEDYSILQMVDEAEQNEAGSGTLVLEQELHKYLASAITKFRYVCRKNLLDTTETGFTEELALDEIEILVNWMLVFYVEGKLMVEDHMMNSLNSRDYKQYSSANLLKELRNLRSLFEMEAKSMTSQYDYFQFKQDWKDKQ